MGMAADWLSWLWPLRGQSLSGEGRVSVEANRG